MARALFDKLHLIAAAACALAALSLASTWVDEHRLASAKSAARAGDFERAVSQSGEISRLPTRVRALSVQGNALLELGRSADAADVFRQAADAEPNDAAIRRSWALALLRSGRTTQARRQMARASALDPAIALPPGFVR